MHTSSRRRGRRIALVLSVVVAAVAGVLLALGGQGATAAVASLRAGLGHRGAHGDFVGYYLTPNGTKVYCLSPTKRLPHTVAFSTVTRYPGRSAVTSDELAYAIAAWGNAHTRAEAVVESQVLNSIAGNERDVRRRAQDLSPAVGKLVASHLAVARARRGPYSVRISTPTAVLPGRSAVGTVRVRSGSGHWLTGVAVTLGHTANVTVPRSVRTNAAGLARFAYAVTGVGRVHITATAQALASTTIRVSHPKAGEQRMVTLSPLRSARASASFYKSPAGFSNSYACTSACDGRPVTHLRACAPASRYASRLVYDAGGRRLVVSYPTSGRAKCRSMSMTLRDGDRVTAQWQFRTPRGWSSPVAASGSFIMDCPAAPKVGVTMSYDCTAASVSIGLARTDATGGWTPLVNTTQHRMVLVVGGARSARVYADRGQQALFTATMTCGAHQTITMRSGVRRGNGHYNYGPVAAITSP